MLTKKNKMLGLTFNKQAEDLLDVKVYYTSDFC